MRFVQYFRRGCISLTVLSAVAACLAADSPADTNEVGRIASTGKGVANVKDKASGMPVLSLEPCTNSVGVSFMGFDFDSEVEWEAKPRTIMDGGEDSDFLYREHELKKPYHGFETVEVRGNASSRRPYALVFDREVVGGFDIQTAQRWTDELVRDFFGDCGIKLEIESKEPDYVILTGESSKLHVWACAELQSQVAVDSDNDDGRQGTRYRLDIRRRDDRRSKLVNTKFLTRDVVIAECVLWPIPNYNSASDIQDAVDKVAKKGGGVVFLKAGSYVLRTPVTVRRGVTIRGDYSADSPSAGTVLKIFGGRGDEEGPPAFSLENGSGLEGLVFYYPDQDANAPVPYPWTVRTAPEGRAGNNQTVVDCTFVNSWQALRIGPETNECHTFRRLRICALKTGFLVDMTTDIGRIVDVLVSPEVWGRSGFRDSPNPEALSAWLKKSGATGAVYRRSDWEYVRRLSVCGYATGIRFEKAKVPTNAVIAGCDVTDCTTALRLDDLNWVGLSCYDTVFSGTSATVSCAPDFRSTALFNACTFKGAPVQVSERGTLNFSHCDIFAAIDASSGGKIERVEGDAPTPAAERLRAESPPFPRPKGNDVFFAAEFGLSRDADDNAPAIQKALDEAGKSADGGTVYVEAGYYRCAGSLRVPSGVELRGSCEVPHHTQNGGTVFLVTAGKGEENGEPFISLAPGSGVRGIGVWYPEQPISEPVAYPWAIRSLGPGCWLTDVNLGNAWQGVDFATHPSDGHRISYVSGGFFKSGIQVGNSKTRGWIEDLQFNPHHMQRLSPGLPVNWGPQKPAVNGEPPLYPLCRRALRGIVLRDCADEKVVGTFLYAARDGISFEGDTHADVLIHGTDTGCRGARLMLAKGGRVRVALGQLVPLGADVEAAIVGDAQNRGEAAFMAVQNWPANPVLINHGEGRISLDQVNACGCSLPDSSPAVSTRLLHQSH